MNLILTDSTKKKERSLHVRDEKDWNFATGFKEDCEDCEEQGEFSASMHDREKKD